MVPEPELDPVIHAPARLRIMAALATLATLATLAEGTACPSRACASCWA